MSGLKENIIEAALYIQKTGLVRGTSGNVSARDGNNFLITPSGMAYSKLNPSDIAEIDLEGEVISGNRKPSIEKDLHRLIYKSRKDIGAVVHVHSIYATAVAAARRSLPVVTDNLAAFFGSEIPCAAYGRSGSLELAQNVCEAFQNGYGVLMSNHGALCVGQTIDEALARCEVLEESAKIFVLAQSLGGAVSLTKDEAECQFLSISKNYGQK